jgi:hypothetical protein
VTFCMLAKALFGQLEVLRGAMEAVVGLCCMSIWWFEVSLTMG